MAILNFTLDAEAIGKLHDCLVCLGKFHETVTIVATKDQLSITALNSTKTAYASFTLSRAEFFTKYSYNPPRTLGRVQEKFTCRIYNKALLSVFKGRAMDPLREKDTGIEKCNVSIEDGAGELKSRFIVQMICRNGILKTYRLTFEPAADMHAIFKQDMAKSSWAISSRLLKGFVEHFGPKTEQLDIFSKDGRATFTSFTEKVVSGKEVLKQPLHTSIAIDTAEFTNFNVEDLLHVVISVKDFKAIVAHAGTTDTEVSAFYSYPSKPMQLKYADDGIASEFILMTIGDHRGSSVTPAPAAARSGSASTAPKQTSEASRRDSAQATGLMAPPPRSMASNVPSNPAKSRSLRPSPPPPQPTLNRESLFLPDDDEDDRRWDPSRYEDEEEDMLGWDATTDNNADETVFRGTLQGYDTQNQSVNTRTSAQNQNNSHLLEPTQRISQIRGMFD